MKKIQILRAPFFVLGILVFIVLFLVLVIFVILFDNKNNSNLSKLEWVKRSIPVGAHSYSSNICFQLKNSPLIGKGSQEKRTKLIVGWTESLNKKGILFESGYETAVEDFVKLNKPLRLTVFHHEDIFLRVSYTSRGDEAWVCLKPSAFDQIPVQVEWKQKTDKGFYFSRIPVGSLNRPLLEAIAETPLFTNEAVGWSIRSFHLINQSVFSLGELSLEFSFK
ncbi:hypothetical protein [Limnobacter sp.]|uniref:hypothetical protein n=1 Tax=Limnobacter sp. TaxID=2003368 RepID=UPI0027B8E281|nr:hypothetical protein [Limnobacter sp.]